MVQGFSLPFQFGVNSDFHVVLPVNLSWVS
jgi:hypothetical protein